MLFSLGIYAALIVIIGFGVGWLMILRLASLADQGVWETLRDYWRTFFGEISDKQD